MCSVSPPNSSNPLSGSDEVRVYQTWKGNNIFFLRGRLVFGPDVRPLALTVLLIVSPVSAFCALVARNLENDFSVCRGVLIMLIAIVFTLYDLILLLLTCGRDPGIIPRNEHPPELETSEGAIPQLRLPRYKNVEVNGTTVKTKYCATCMLYRPPRCSHCSICNNCVERFDHHCPWIGQCIGLRNYRFFFMFVFSTTLLCVYVFGFCWVYIMKIMATDGINIWMAMIKTPASIVLIVYTFIAFCLIGVLTLFHLYFISTNQTTYENFRRRHDHHTNIYDKGVVKNFKEILCGFTPPSKNNFWAIVHKELPLPSRDESSAFVSLEIVKGNDDIEMGREGVWEDRNEVLGDVCVALDHTEGGRLRYDESLNTSKNGDDVELGKMSLEIYVTVDKEDPLRCLSLGRKSGSWEMLPKVLDLASRMGEMNRTGEKSSNVGSFEMRL